MKTFCKTSLFLFTVIVIISTGSYSYAGGPPMWQTNGNAGLNPTTDFLGTTDAVDLIFKANGIEYMRIEPISGAVGIGTVFPAGKLEINMGNNDDHFRFNDDGNIGLELRSGTTAGTPYIDFINDPSTDFDMRLRLTDDNVLQVEGGALDLRGHLLMDDGPNDAAVFHKPDNSGFDSKYWFRKYNGTSYTDLMVIDNDGKVGVSMSSPAYKLDVAGGSINTTDDYKIAGHNAVSMPVNSFNICVGRNAGGSLTTGDSNSMLGRNAGFSTTTGVANSFMGNEAGRTNNGSYNSNVGFRAGRENINGDNNTGVGAFAGELNDGNYNTFLGYNADIANISGLTNVTAIGANASVSANNSLVLGSINGVNGATASTNVGIGVTAPSERLEVDGNIKASGVITTSSYYSIAGNRILSNIGIRNTMVGEGSGVNNTGANNTFIGFEAGRDNTTGGANVFVGSNSGIANISGSGNSFFGDNTGVSYISGQYNTLIGVGAGLLNTDGNYNTFLGGNSGNGGNSGDGNTYLGWNARGSGNFNNATAIGADALVSASNSLVLGNNANVGIGVTAPSEKLEVNGNIKANGTIESTSGGVKFPDATIQTTAANLGGSSNASFIDLDVSHRIKVGTSSLFLGNPSTNPSIENNIWTTNSDLLIQDGTPSPTGPGSNFNTILNANGSTGNVGIGTSSPTSKLHVQGSGAIGNNCIASASTAFAAGNNNIASNQGCIALGEGCEASNFVSVALGFESIASNSLTVAIGARATASGVSSFAIGNRVTSSAANSLTLGRGNNLQHLVNNIPNSLMVGFNSNLPTLFVGPSFGIGKIGKVGIGITTPQDILHIQALTNDGYLRVGAVGAGNNYVKMGYDGFNCRLDAFDNVGPQLNRLLINYDTGGDVVMGGGPGGSCDLQVNGKISTCEVEVTNSGWCDYVFEEGYELMPLTEVDQFIKLNKHLPAIPPASEIEEGGLKLGEMNIRMMEKIEELTLYIIDQEKRIKELERESSQGGSN